MSKLTKRVVDAAEGAGTRILIWEGSAWLRAARPAQRSQAIHYTSTAPGDARAASALDPAPCCPANRHVAGRSPSLRDQEGDDPAAQPMPIGVPSPSRSSQSGFTKEHIDLRLKPSTGKGYKLERFVIPRLGNHPL